MQDILERLKKEVLLCDGAMGTMLQDKGLAIGESPEAWNLKNRDAVKAVHKSYIDAGSDMVITNTFGGNEIKLKRAGLEDKMKDVNLYGASLAREAAGDDIYVLGDVGPTGGFLKPAGNLNFDDMYNVFSEQIEYLKEGGVDCIIIETMTDLGEVKAAIKAAKDTAGLPVIATMTFQRGRVEYKTMMGASIPDSVKSMKEGGADVIGSNCGSGTSELAEIAKQMRALTDSPLIFQPNAGLPKLVEDKAIFDETPEKFSEGVSKILEIGVNIIGGCCGTTPEHICKVKKLLVT